jgi:hypothetical protein
MQNGKQYILAIGLLIILFQLSSVPTGVGASQDQRINTILADDTEENSECIIPCHRIVSPLKKDSIPSIDNPKFLSASSNEAPADTEAVIGIVIDGVARAYPIDILNWHEIVNDETNGKHFSVTYCPLTDTGILYHADTIDDAEFGTSGSLYENNLIMYDRITGSYWSQMLGLAFQGDQIGTELAYGNTIEINWGTWKKMYPDTMVLSRDTGFERDYDVYPYGSYKFSRSILFQSSYRDDEADFIPYNLYHPKDITTILKVGDIVKHLPLKELAKYPVLNHQVSNQQIVTVFDEDHQLSLTYSSTLSDGSTLEFYENVEVSIDQSQSYDLITFQDLSGSIFLVCSYNHVPVSAYSG